MDGAYRDADLSPLAEAELRDLATVSGGELIRTGKDADLAPALARIAFRLANEYTVGFRPVATHKVENRKLKAEFSSSVASVASSKGWSLSARRSYRTRTVK
jgi:hypothetical protein